MGTKKGSSKDSKSKETRALADGAEISSNKELRRFLENIRDRMSDGTSASIYSLSSMNGILNNPKIYGILDEENKEIARDIWLRIKASGVNVQLPPILFEPNERGEEAG